ncbi:hypothetical protein ADE_08170 [Achromobacter denitrificans]|nr:hypothetical protein ADE_08170 [Achromobacter denitrificans]
MALLVCAGGGMRARCARGNMGRKVGAEKKTVRPMAVSSAAYRGAARAARREPIGRFVCETKGKTNGKTHGKTIRKLAGSASRTATSASALR